MWEYLCGDIVVNTHSRVKVPEISGHLVAWNMNLLAVGELMGIGCKETIYIYQLAPEWSERAPRLLGSYQMDGVITRVSVHKGIPYCFVVTLLSNSVALVFFRNPTDIRVLRYPIRDSSWGCSGETHFTAASSNDWNIRIWDKRDGSRRTLSGHNHNIPSVEIRNGLIVSASIDCTVRVWDIQTGLQIAQYRGNGWGWAAHLIGLGSLQPSFATNSEMIVRKLAPAEIVSFVHDFGQIDEPLEVDIGIPVPEDQLVIFENSNYSDTEYQQDDDIENSSVENYEYINSSDEAINERLELSAVFGENVNSSHWESTEHPDSVDNTSERWDIVLSTEEDSQHSHSEFDSFASTSEEEPTVKEKLNDLDETRKRELYSNRLVGQYLVAFTTSTDFYLLRPNPFKNGELEPLIHFPRMLHSTVSPDQRALLANMSLVWSLDRMAFSVFIEDISVLLIVNQIGFISAVRIVSCDQVFSITFPSAVDPLHPIAGIAYRRLDNIVGSYLIYILRLDGTLETYSLRNLSVLKCIELPTNNG